MTKKQIYVIRATSRDKKELSKAIFDNYQFHFQTYDDTLLEKVLCRCIDAPLSIESPSYEINELIHFAQTNKIDAILCTEDYPGCLYASVVAKELNRPAASTQSILSCSHKYISRTLQQRYVPNATPAFCLISKTDKKATLPFPFFVKPLKSYFSIYANKITTQAEYQQALASSLPPALFLQEFNWFIENHSTFKVNANYLLAESLLSGQQVTLEGFVFNGNITVYGIVDSIMFPDTICFERFDYPSRLSQDVQNRMAEIADCFMKAIHFDNGLFNIEFMYNPQSDSIHIIEVNPRMSSQFADLYEKVDGFNPYSVLIDIALNKEPVIHKNKGPFKLASSFILRLFEDKLANQVPSMEVINQLNAHYPDAHVEIYAKEGENLSSFLQDGKSYRYGIINIGEQNDIALNAKFKQCKNLLPFDFLACN